MVLDLCIPGLRRYQFVTGTMLAWAIADKDKYRINEMDSYIIRIYRRNVDRPDLALGVLENPSDGAQRSFRSCDELWKLLAEDPLRDKKIKKKTSEAIKQRPE